MKGTKIRHPVTPPPPLDAAAIIAKKYRLTVAHARLVAELAGIRTPADFEMGAR